MEGWIAMRYQPPGYQHKEAKEGEIVGCGTIRVNSYVSIRVTNFNPNNQYSIY